MGNSRLAVPRPKPWSSPLPYFISVALQAILFLSATAALTLFYLSYRPGDFIQSFIVTGLALIAPWLLISLLPTFFGIEDRELRSEILLRQLISMVLIVIVLVGLSFYIGFHRELFTLISSYIQISLSFIGDIWHSIISYISSTIIFLSELFTDTVLPLFSD